MGRPTLAESMEEAFKADPELKKEYDALGPAYHLH